MEDGQLTRTSIAIGTRKKTGRPKVYEENKPSDRVNFNKKDLDLMRETVMKMNSKVEELYTHKLNKLKARASSCVHEVNPKELQNIQLDVSEESEEEQPIIIRKKPKQPKVVYIEDESSSSAPSEVSTTTTSESSVEPVKKKSSRKSVKSIKEKAKPKPKSKKEVKMKTIKKSKKKNDTTDTSDTSSDSDYPTEHSRFTRPTLNIF